jgi:RNA polymerase sigma factor (sigma-70 family)
MSIKTPSGHLAARLNELHQANLLREPTAPAKVFSLAFLPLCKRIKKSARNAADDQVSDACTDAIIAYLRKPAVFDPSRSSLWTFLFVIATRRLLDYRRAARRREFREETGVNFEVLAVPANKTVGEEHLLAHEIDARYMTEIANDSKELRVLELMCCGVRETDQYAQALGLAIDDPAVGREVKRVKDKLKARLRKVRDVLGTTNE